MTKDQLTLVDKTFRTINATTRKAKAKLVACDFSGARANAQLAKEMLAELEATLSSIAALKQGAA